MKKLLLTVIFLTAATVFAQGQKIGYVDSQAILAQYAPAIKAQSDMDALASKWAKSRDSLNTELQNQYMAYEKQKSMMTPDKQKETEQNLVRLQQQIQMFTQQKFGQQGELFQKQQELMTPIKNEIVDAISKVAKAEGMKFIFDKTGDVILLYADDEYNMTFKVLDQLRKK